MKNRSFTLLLISLLLFSTSMANAHSPPADARIYFVGISDGAVVSSPFKLQFGIQGFGITPAGTTGKLRHNAGHHHLLVDLEQLPDMDEPIPRDRHHLHFDQGETETLLELTPGSHTLQLLLGDEEHEPQAPALLSEQITIWVE